MIEISVRKNEITVAGHAQYASLGKDIVCSGVSTLVQTLIASIKILTKDEIQYDLSLGTADIKFENLSKESQTLVDSFLVGIQMIADTYPEHVRIV